MKNITSTICFILLGAVISLFDSCSKSPITFTIPITKTLSYGPYATVNGTAFTTTLQSSKLDSFITALGGVPSDLQSIDLQSLTVVLDSPVNHYFNEFNGFTAYIKDSSDSTKFAYLAPVPQNTDTLTFSSQYVDMSPYFNASSFSIDLVGTWVAASGTSELPKETVTVNFVAIVTIKGH